MAKPITGQIARVRGPYAKPNGRWQAQIDTEDGKTHHRTFSTKTKATLFINGCREVAQQPNAPRRRSFRRWDKSSGWWADLLAKAAREAYTEPSALNQSVLRSISQAAKSAAPHMSQAELEKRVREVEDRQDVIDAARDAPRSKGPSGLSRSTPVPGSPVC